MEVDKLMKMLDTVITGYNSVSEQIPILNDDGDETGEYETVTHQEPVFAQVERDMTEEELDEYYESQASMIDMDAIRAAENKNRNFYSATEPSTGLSEGDAWFKLDNSGNIIAFYRYDGEEWVNSPLTSAVFSYIDAGKITTGTLNAIDITGSTLKTATKPSTVITIDSLYGDGGMSTSTDTDSVCYKLSDDGLTASGFTASNSNDAKIKAINQKQFNASTGRFDPVYGFSVNNFLHVNGPVYTPAGKLLDQTRLSYLLNSETFRSGRAKTGADGIITIEFDDPFGGTPRIFVTPLGSTTNTIISLKATSISADGFTVVATRMTNGSNAIQPVSVNFDWFAVRTNTF